MIELSGKYGIAKVFTDVVDNESISQVINLLNQPYIEGSKVRMMPDIHAGAGCTIGTTMTITDKICPNLVGVDIGCGMLTTKLKDENLNLPDLDRIIRKYIPSGFNIHDSSLKYEKMIDLSELRCFKHINVDRAYKSIGTLGGGNHFIEVDKDESGILYLVIHSGSRHLGKQVAEYYQKSAYKALSEIKKEDIKIIITSLKEAHMESEIDKTLKELKKNLPSIPENLAYVTGELLEDYLYDMNIVQRYAELNRKEMADIIINKLGLTVSEQFSTIHNYIDVKNRILRKGAVSAQEGEKLLIPINMRDGSLICIGKGNEDWNCSAPHGAGRLMSRSAAKEMFSVKEFEAEMKEIYSTSVGQSTLDECPMAYKSMESIVDNIHPTADIISVIKPIYNFKASD